MTWYEGAIAGLIAGGAYGFSGFWKAKKTENKPFDWKVFLMSVVPATLIGAGLGLFKLPADSGNIGIYLDGTAGVTITAILKKILRI